MFLENRKNMHTKASMIITIAAIILLLVTMPVFADGEVLPDGTPESENPTVESGPTETADAVDDADEPAGETETNDAETVAANADETFVAGETTELPQEEAAPTPEAAPESSGPEEIVVEATDSESTIISEAAQSDLALTDEDGEPLQMASEESAAAITDADPYFYVGSTKYQFYPFGMFCPAGTEGVTCWVSAEGENPIQDAIDYINTNGKLPTDRKIYVESGEYTGDVSIDTSTQIFSSLLNGLIGAGSSTTTINGNILINQNIAGFTLSGFTINGSLQVTDSIGTLVLDDLDVTSPDGDGINIHDQDGNVVIKNTRSSGNHGSGAIIDYETTAGIVTVTNSAFDDNGNSLNQDYEVGVLISTTKSIKLEGVSASRNQGNGFELADFSALTIRNAIASYNEEIYNANMVSEGIYAVTDLAASVTLENIQANYNASDGIYIGTNGNVTATNIEAQYNTMRTGTIADLQKAGEFLSDDVDYDEWRFTWAETKDALITLESTGKRHTFDPLLRLYDSNYQLIMEDDNGLDGINSQIFLNLPAAETYYLRVYRADSGTHGSYELALNHDDDVAHVINRDASGFSFSTWDGTGKFKLTNGYFNQNAGEGLYVYNRNYVNITTIKSTNNGGDGIYINKSGSDWECPQGGGACTLLGYSGKGIVTITSPRSTGWLTANSTTGNDGAGLYVFSTGNINVSNIDAVENAIGGLTLNNCLLDFNTGLCQGNGSVNVNVTIPNWSNYFGENSGNGLDVSSTGSVKISDVSARYNGNKGIEVGALNAIYLNRVEVFHNYDTGAYLSTLAASRARSISVTDSTFDENEGTGLVIDASGSIFLKGVSADDNFSPLSGTLDNVPASVYDQIKLGDLYEVYYFYGQGGQWLDIILNSSEFDAYLALNDNVGEEITNDDNSGDGSNARIIYSLPYTGWFQIEVSYIGVDEEGDYVLSVNDYYNEHPVYPGSGITLDNTSGTGNIVVTTTRNSPVNTTSDNDNFGLYVKTNGSVSINNTSGDSNYRSGLFVDAIKAVSVQDKNREPVTTFNNNGYYGMDINTLGAITLSGVSGSGNALNGADLENCFYSGDDLACTGSGKISISTKRNYLADFSSNGGYGIRIDASGTINLLHVNAESNGLSGVYLRNDYHNGAVNIRNTSKTVMSAFDDNGGYGIFIRTLRFINLFNLSANGNALSGAYLDACREDEGACLGSGYVKIGAYSNMQSSFDGNADHGILANAFSTITLFNVSADGNGLSGAYLKNDFEGARYGVNVNRSGNDIINTFDNNGSAGVYGGSAPAYRVGLFIETHGIINMKYLSASGTQDGGVDSAYYGAPQAGSGLLAFNNLGELTNRVSITAGTFSNNDNYGMQVFSYGYISLRSVDASANGNIGAYVKNDYPEYSNGVSLLTFRGAPNIFNANNGNGLQVETNGSVSLRDLEASNNAMLHNTFASGGIETASVQEHYNDALGADVWEFYATAGVPLSIQLNSIWSPSGQVFDPLLELYNAGDVLLAQDDNSGLGDLDALIDYTPSADGWYYLKANGNFGVDGGYVLAINDPALSDVTVLTSHGASIQAANNVTITASDFNYFNSNAQSGIQVDTGGRISVQRVSAQDNGTIGAKLDNTSGTSHLSVFGKNTRVYSYFSGNGQDGLVANTNGNLTLKNLWAEANILRGIAAGASGAPVSGRVTIDNILALENGSHGVESYNSHLVTVQKIHALDNGGTGAYFNNTSGTSKVTINGDSYFSGNGGDGLQVLSAYNVSISRIVAERNSGDGIDVEAGDGNISLNRIEVKYSGTHGLNISGNNNITLSNLTSFNNGFGTDGDGVHITAALTTSVTIKNASFMANEGSGIEIAGALAYPTLNNTFYFGNDTDNDGDMNLYLH